MHITVLHNIVLQLVYKGLQLKKGKIKMRFNKHWIYYQI